MVNAVEAIIYPEDENYMDLNEHVSNRRYKRIVALVSP